jgi:hypothetical protein
MADEKTVAKRAENYEKNKRKNIKIILAEIALISTLIPLTMHKGITSKTKNVFTNFIKKYASLTDYTKGVFMSKFTTILGLIASSTGVILFSRNNTERKDFAIRLPLTNAVMMGGDLVVTSVLANISDKILKTKLCKENQKGILKKIFPAYKSLEQIGKEVSINKIANTNKNIATIVYWLGMGLCSAMLGFGVPKVCNAIIKRDVKNYVENNNSNPRKNYEIPEVFKQFLINKT